MATYRNRNKKIVKLGGELGGGGEGKVYAVAGNTEQVAKIWSLPNLTGANARNTGEMDKKLDLMLRTPLGLPTEAAVCSPNHTYRLPGPRTSCMALEGKLPAT